MTGRDVDHPEMPTPDDVERAIEALLGGRRAAVAEVESLALFADDLRVAVSGPAPAPGPQLARLLTEGFSIHNGELSATAGTADRPDPPTADRLTRRSPKMTISELLAALAAKLGSLGVAAKVALGLGLATASAAGAGAAGVLPAPAQHAVATVVNATPLDIPDGTDGHDPTPAVTTITDSNPPAVDDPTGAADDATGTDDPRPGDNHGACVSAVADSAPTGAGGVHGQAVSDAAKICPKAIGPDDEETTTTVGSGGATTDPTGQDHGQSGQGHGQSGQGHGGSEQHGHS